MALRSLAGLSTTLIIHRLEPTGARLVERRAASRQEPPTLLLPSRDVPEGAAVGDEVRVFVHHSSEDVLTATTRTPRLELDQVAFLEVTAVNAIGAFVDWGLGKELLVPFSEQTLELTVGMRHPIGLYVDSSGRLAGTMRISEMLATPPGDLSPDTWVLGEAWRNDPDIGLFVILDRTFVGLLPAREPHRLRRGEPARFRVARIHPDGKVELSLRAHAHEELASDSERILESLRGPNPPRLGDRSAPDAIRDAYDISKKAFKRAVGQLLKRGAVRIDDDGCVVANP